MIKTDSISYILICSLRYNLYCRCANTEPNNTMHLREAKDRLHCIKEMHLGADVCELPAAPGGRLLHRGRVHGGPGRLAGLTSCGHLHSAALPSPRHFSMDFPTDGGKAGREGGVARQDAGAEAEPGRRRANRTRPQHMRQGQRRRRSVMHPGKTRVPDSATRCSIQSCSERIALTPPRPPSPVHTPSSHHGRTPPLTLHTSWFPTVCHLTDLKPQQHGGAAGQITWG
jgi:hypothetical protein